MHGRCIGTTSVLSFWEEENPVLLWVSPLLSHYFHTSFILQFNNARCVGFPLTKQLNSTLTLSAWIWSQTPQLKAQSHKTTLSPHFRCQSQVEILYIYIEQGTEKAMAPHSSTLAWKIPRTEEPGGLQSMGSWRVGHDWATSLSLFTFMHRRRKRQPTPVFLPGESQGQGSLVGCRLCGHTESDTTEATWRQQQQQKEIYSILHNGLYGKRI